MAIPVLAGLPWLIGVIASIVGSVIASMGKWATKRILLITAAITAIGLAIFAFSSAIEALLSTIAVAMPPEIQMAFLIIPSNVSECASAIVVAHVARWVYSVHLRVISIKVS